jgi:hypothetical protein
MPVLDRLLTWFDPEVRDFGNIPSDGPCMLVGNHSGFMYLPDYWAPLRRWVAERGPESPISTARSNTSASGTARSTIPASTA